MNEFRHALKAERMARGMSQDALGAQVHVTGSQIGNYESGRSVPPEDVASRLDTVLSADGELAKQAEAARAGAVAPWMRPWAATEQLAMMLRWWEPSIIPGILQTEAYARSVIAAGPHTDAQVEAITRDRLERQSILDRPVPVGLTAIMDEAALRHGDPEVMKEQLDHLIDIGHRPGVHVRVVPMGAGMYAGLTGAFVLATLPDGGTVAYCDDQVEGKIIKRAIELRRLVTVWEAICAQALPWKMSRDLILRMIDEHERASMAHVQPQR
ncbi:helix-turn-helix domain-containing protein [Micromonospora sp. NBC_01813]|uniref:helix-turn-helix domain-containing protein n=1 Tax=Micromonospora sp. NBC_01813 TaxID=2975988 RepID=UPI002DD95F6E|nr:helix-turn-helix transcriptional regulator [Micromonospora sp. NBC_01813]WSA12605.1 helix-turn-helix transcriptional regulator [Micromonospora sp. NBC_01813]